MTDLGKKVAKQHKKRAIRAEKAGWARHKRKRNQKIKQSMWDNLVPNMFKKEVIGHVHTKGKKCSVCSKGKRFI